MNQPSIASPLEIFFRHLVMSAAVRDKEAKMLTSGREPDDESSAEIGRTERGIGKEHMTSFLVMLGVRVLTISVVCGALRGTRLHRQSQSSKQRLELHQIWILSGQTSVREKTPGRDLHSQYTKSQ